VELLERPFPVHLPTITLVDMRHEVKHRLSHGLFSSVLLDYLEAQLREGKQSILFRNRRGYAPYVQCQSCGYVFMCTQCDLTLTYHKWKNQLLCHYCHYHQPFSPVCPQCQSTLFHPVGIGTERVEEQLKELFPNARIARMDLDTTRSKYAHQHLIRELEYRQIDILIGTQMVTKGLDFENVTLVGVLDADKLLYYPSFRAYEHAYHLLVQFRGRAARSHLPGRMVIQTFTPNNPFFQLLDEPFSTFFETLLPGRKQHGYPPFYRLVEVELQSPDPDYVEAVAAQVGTVLRAEFGERILGPSIPSVQRLRNRYRRLFLLKWERRIGGEKEKERLMTLLRKALPKGNRKGLRVLVNVDP
jgi:primosomal protein N' (replication factor Y)